MQELPPEKIISKIPSKADLDHCPLCLKKWKIIEEDGKTGRAFFACWNQKCMITIWVRDPLLGRWQFVEPEPCPVCKAPTRLFFRSDGYIKMACPKCGLVIENVDPDKHEALIRGEEARGERKIISGEKPEMN